MVYLSNAFSLQMLQDFPCNVCIEEVSQNEAMPLTLVQEPSCDEGGVQCGWGDYRSEWAFISAIGHQDTANVLGVPMNRINVCLEKGDVLFVAQLQGGRLPEGSTELPEGFSFKFFKVTLG